MERPAFTQAALSSVDSIADAERDQRTPREWIDAVLGYLEFRAGSGWRKGRWKHRQSPVYQEYLDAIRIVLSACRAPEDVPAPVSTHKFDVEPERPRWIDCPHLHFARCRCARCRSAKKRAEAS